MFWREYHPQALLPHFELRKQTKQHFGIWRDIGTINIFLVNVWNCSVFFHCLWTAGTHGWSSELQCICVINYFDTRSTFIVLLLLLLKSKETVGLKFLDRFKSYSGSQISSHSLNEVLIYWLPPKSATEGDFFHIFLSLIVSSWRHGLQMANGEADEVLLDKRPR